MRPVFLASLPISFLESALPLSSRTGNGNSGNEILKGSLSNDDVDGFALSRLAYSIPFNSSNAVKFLWS